MDAEDDSKIAAAAERRAAIEKTLRARAKAEKLGLDPDAEAENQREEEEERARVARTEAAEQWYFLDDSGNQQGPFPRAQMLEW